MRLRPPFHPNSLASTCTHPAPCTTPCPMHNAGAPQCPMSALQAPRMASHTRTCQPLCSRHLQQSAQSRRPRVAPCRAAHFEPQAPDPAVIGSQVAVLAVTLGAAGYWWMAVVPAARQSLAKDKRAGPARAYLEGLQQDEGKKLERWFYTGGWPRPASCTSASGLFMVPPTLWGRYAPACAPTITPALILCCTVCMVPHRLAESAGQAAGAGTQGS